ncbi:hypothetical protein DD237_000490 [Peronospora effusa]|uniref:Vacuolar ATPase assembly integral membrane protein VMA21 homolog n=1 Tax=Peronospora effusa TaxID=542832 RepID=A0A3R7XMS1_9STRA|nr:hypothetical protein DD237_000490 [Peronospora effusa]
MTVSKMLMKTKSLSGMQQRAAGSVNTKILYINSKRRHWVMIIWCFLCYSNRAHNRMVLQKLVVFSILMGVVPLSTFYGVRSILKPGKQLQFLIWTRGDHLMGRICLGEPGSQYADAWSGFTAVLSVNIVIGIYILSAWKEKDEKDVAPPVGRFAKAKEQ